MARCRKGSYIDGQLVLTKQIVARERSFGMKPILPAFAGHVPAALKRASGNKVDATALVRCLDVVHRAARRLFREIEVKFLREQKNNWARTTITARIRSMK